MISFETARDVFAVIGCIATLWLAIKWLGRGLAWIERTEIERQEAEAKTARVAPRAAASNATPGPEMVPAEHVAAIAAAVAALGGGLRLVTIDDPTQGHAWALEGRWMHQTSHRG